MDDDFFDFSKEFTRTTVRAGFVNGRKAPEETDFNTRQYKKPHIGTDYAIEHRMKAENIMLEASMMDSVSHHSRMDSIDDDLDSSLPKCKGEILEIYKKYNFDITTDSTNMPINSSKFHILNTIENNQAVILQGPTGCGKTTQVPQYILDNAKQQNQYCNIVVTQPRKIAAKSLAKFVCDERQWQLGTLVGYQVGLNVNINEDTRILYCTTGILLQKLIGTKRLTTFTHIILDEVHERDSEMDFLLIVIKKLLSENYQKVKIILMSATISTIEFSEYFKTPRMGIFENAPIVSVGNRKIYNVKEFYLCQLDRLKPNKDINYNEPGISTDMYYTALQLISVCARFEECKAINGIDYKPSILVFLPGLYEIENMASAIKKSQESNKFDTQSLLVLPLHSTITSDEQEKIFLPPPPGGRKVILSTNIAESSITVKDIKYVIDFCLTKNLMTDPNTNFTGLKLEWASKANCIQRSGRAGRVMNGRVYRLVSKRFYDFHMQESAVPEMLRCPLEQIVLKAKILDMGPPHSILALAMNAPNLSDIGNTILGLKSVGAMYKTVAGNYDVLDGDITYMGRVMAALPLDIRSSKLIILGYIFNVLNDAIIIAAGLSIRNIFSVPFELALEAYYQKLCWSDGSGSDLFAILNAYKVWHSKKKQNMFGVDENEKCWAKRYYVQLRAMRELAAQIIEIKSRLKRYNLTEIRSNEKHYWSDQEKYLVLKIIICGAFYPHYFHRANINERDAFHVLGGLDPSKTVYFKGMEPKYIGILYEKRIKEILKKITKPNDIKITFDVNSQRLFATFLKGDQYFHKKKLNQDLHLVNSMPGHILLEVYKACKLAKIQAKHKIEVLTPSDAIKFAKNHQIGVIENGTWQPKKEKIKKLYHITPALDVKEMIGIMPHIEHCSKFFFQPNSTLTVLKQIHDILIPEHLVPFVEPSDINESDIIAAPFTNDVHDEFDHISYYRVKVIGYEKEDANTKYFSVYYIDYGNKSSVKFSDLRRVTFVDELKNIPPCVFECCLCEVQPSCFVSPQELWTASAVKELKDFKDKSKFVTIEIYSFVNGIASVRLKKGNLCFNEILVQNKLAQFAEENYMSKANHELRERIQATQFETGLSDNMNNEEEDLNVADIEPPRRELCHHRITIMGPYSPLETQLFSLMRVSEYNSARIDQQSINSVLLDTLSSSDSRKLIVAAEVGSQSSANLVARNTTLMPNIKGFDVLMGLLFCPTMQLKRDPKNTRFAGALTGLGYNPKTLEPLDSEHDILFKMDVEITIDDLERINAIRYYMDALLHTSPGDDFPQNDEHSKMSIMNKIMENLPQLLEKPRQSVEVTCSKNDDQWTNVKVEDVIAIQDIFGFRTIYPVHQALTLEEPKGKDLTRLLNNCTELHKIAKQNVLTNTFTCLLCNQTLENITQVRIHLYTFLHVDREKQINFQQ